MKLLYLPTMEIKDDYLEPGNLHRVIINKGPFVTSLDSKVQQIDREEKVYDSVGKIVCDYKLLDFYFTEDELRQLYYFSQVQREDQLANKCYCMFNEQIRIKKVTTDTIEMLENNVKRLNKKVSQLENENKMLEQEAMESVYELDEHYDTIWNPLLKIMNKWHEMKWYQKILKANKVLWELFYHINPHMKKEN